MQAHSVANLFPMMSNDEYAALVADIHQYGQREPIWTLDGQILDGRNRWQACRDLGIQPITREYIGPTDMTTLVSFVVSLNLKRRHLSGSQKAAVGTKIKDQLQEANPPGRPSITENVGNISYISTDSNKQNRDLAGEIVGVSGRYIDEADRIQEAAPDLFDELLAGTMSIPDAKREMKAREKEHARQERAANPPPVLPDACAIEHTNTTAHLRPNSVDAIITDPPYGISHYAGVTKVGDQIVTADFDGDDAWDSVDPDAFLDTMYGWIEEWERILRPGGSVIAFTDRALVSHMWDAMKKVGLRPKQIIAWVKTNPAPAGLARKNLISATEFMVWAVAPGAPYTFNEVDGWDRRNVIITPIIGGNEKVDHPTQKPVAVLSKLIQLVTRPGDLVLDPFAGSGSTADAAMRLGRRAHLIEQNIDYVRLAQARLAAAEREQAA